MSDEYDPEMEEELHELSQEIGEMVVDFTEKISPMRVALAGLVLILLLGALVSTWYWVIPRDDVEIEVMYLQRNGHIVLVELVNDGSREITDVELRVDFVDNSQTVLGNITVSLKSVASHTSVSGDDMELDLRGYSVWEEYTIQVNIKWTDFRGVENEEKFIHKVSENITERFHDECEEVTWFL
ncbi:MAG: hypothetical protein ACJZ4V_05675 [Candidatus Poseidoniaceae archaeon]|tara:strand:- start:71 stop:622 length:552 start_codon:yes stop_codon:yes gene_type:complete